MDEITIGDKVYVSSKRAAKITGYAKDYIGQLCREGRVEARLVGRNWYVLDTAIREHRFGKEEHNEAPQTAPEEVKDTVSTWKKPQYSAEVPVFVPDLSEKREGETVGSPAIADMQSAWREWFQDKQQVQALPDGSQDFKEEYLPVVIPNVQEAPEDEIEEAEEQVHINKVSEEVATEESSFGPENTIEIHKSYEVHAPQPQLPTAVPLSNQRVYPAASPVVKRESFVLQRVVLFLVAFLALGVALIGSGHAEPLLSGTSLDYGVQKSVIDYLGGKSEYKSRL